MNKDKLPPFAVGIEEECILTDIRSGEAIALPPGELYTLLQQQLGDCVSTEARASQIEIKTLPCYDFSTLRHMLQQARLAIQNVTSHFNALPIFASTHPISTWKQQIYTNEKHILKYADFYQRCEARSFVCGMHIHINVPDKDLRIRLLNQLKSFLPLLLALSTSSPFWNGEDTGLESYRICIWHNLPRTGLPPSFENWQQYEAYLSLLQSRKIISTGKEVWWDIRPNINFPTLELRICDVCHNINDAIAIAAFYQALAYRLSHDNDFSERYCPKKNWYIEENIWQAQRSGLDGMYINANDITPKSQREYINELLTILQPDAKKLGTSTELNHISNILQNSTGSKEQKSIYNAAIAEGHSTKAALQKVVSYLLGISEESIVRY